MAKSIDDSLDEFQSKALKLFITLGSKIYLYYLEHTYSSLAYIALLYVNPVFAVLIFLGQKMFVNALEAPPVNETDIVNFENHPSEIDPSLSGDCNVQDDI